MDILIFNTRVCVYTRICVCVFNTQTHKHIYIYYNSINYIFIFTNICFRDYICQYNYYLFMKYIRNKNSSVKKSIYSNYFRNLNIIKKHL